MLVLSFYQIAHSRYFFVVWQYYHLSGRIIEGDLIFSHFTEWLFTASLTGLVRVLRHELILTLSILSVMNLALAVMIL